MEAVEGHRPPSIEEVVRRAALLPASLSLHPCGLRPFRRLDAALRTAKTVAESPGFSNALVGVFAEDLSCHGSKCWYVDTFAGFVLRNVPSFESGCIDSILTECRHYAYEVLRADRPCWLYFDLEYNMEDNPNIISSTVMNAFYICFVAFCRSTFFVEPVEPLELDSCTRQKFSKHIIIKRWKFVNAACVQYMAFADNTHVGEIVHQFIEYTRTLAREDEASLAASLFLRSHTKGMAHLVDSTVYTRNRCFRVMFSRKKGRGVPLVPPPAMRHSRTPSEMLLDSLASFVPDNTVIWCRHAPDRVLSQLRERRCDQINTFRMAPFPFHAAQQLQERRFSLTEYLVNFWDTVRGQFETTNATKTTVSGRPIFTCEGRFLSVSLQNNRFCACKCASHKSNRIYLVVDFSRLVFYQKCHDSDCHGFRSSLYPLPLHYCGTLHREVSRSPR